MLRDGRLMVPGVNSPSNLDMRDVIGNKNDTHASDSLSGHAHNTNDHFHQSCYTWPTLADGITVTAAAGPWGLSAGFTEIAAVADIAIDFDIHYISIEDLSANDVYELWLYAVEVFLGRVRFTKNANQDGTMNVPFQCPVQPANTQIQAKLATKAGGSRSADISLFWHPY